MNGLIKITAMVLLTLSSGCDSAKSSSNQETKESSTMTKTAQDMENMVGYTKGVIKENSDVSCPFVLIDEDSDMKYDPINIGEKTFDAFKKNNSKVYFKYQPLRMMNRCPDMQPIRLLDVKTRSN